MYRTSYQRGMITVLFSGGSNPLGIWEITKSKDGYVERFLDQDIKAVVIEIGGNNVTTTYLTCPPGKKVLGICMPFLVMIVKNLNKYFVFEITILDDTGTRRRFRIANFQSTTQITPLCTVMPLHLSDGWNQIQFNLAEFTRRAYNKQFVEVQKIRINANIRIRRIYCAEKLMSEEELPPEYKLYFPLQSKKKANGKENKEQQTSVGKKMGSKLDVYQASVVAPAIGAPVKPAEEAPAKEVPAESTAGESSLDEKTEEGAKVLADLMLLQSLSEGKTQEVEELTGEEPAAEAETELEGSASGSAAGSVEAGSEEQASTVPTEPAEPKDMDEGPPSTE